MPGYSWPKRTAVVPRAVFITDEFFRDIEAYLRDNLTSQRRFQWGLNVLVQLMATLAKGYAQADSRGIVDPRQTTGRSWEVPVRRITSQYYHGWKVRRIRHAVWVLYNDSREAYYIEYGIHVSPNRVRRPVLKRTFLQTQNAIRRHPGIRDFTVWMFMPSQAKTRGSLAIAGGGSIR